MENKRGLIFDIQGFSVHDGPGCRTLVFLSGCHLRCKWCANPEGWEYTQRLMFTKEKCKHLEKGCNRCISACNSGAIYITSESDIVLNRSLCNKCKDFNCVKSCNEDALRLSGKYYNIDDVMKVILRDSGYWGKRGGVTFSGGEPFLQHEFLIELLRRCKELNIHTSIETTAYIDTEIFLEGAKYLDFMFIDLKHMDSNKHKEFTGVHNNLILKNIRLLRKTYSKKRIILRMPIIKDFNDSEENMDELIKYMNDVGLVEINILPFHRLGDSKWSQLGMVYPYKDFEATNYEFMEKIQDKFLKHDIVCYIGEEVLY